MKDSRENIKATDDLRRRFDTWRQALSRSINSPALTWMIILRRMIPTFVE